VARGGRCRKGVRRDKHQHLDTEEPGRSGDDLIHAKWGCLKALGEKRTQRLKFNNLLNENELNHQQEKQGRWAMSRAKS